MFSKEYGQFLGWIYVFAYICFSFLRLFLRNGSVLGMVPSCVRFLINYIIDFVWIYQSLSQPAAYPRQYHTV